MKKTKSKPNLSIKSISRIKTDRNDIIPFGTVYSSIGIRLNQHCRNITEIPSFAPFYFKKGRTNNRTLTW